MKKRDFTMAWRPLALLGALLLGGCVEVTEAPGEHVGYTGPTRPVALDAGNAGPVLARAWALLDGVSVDAPAWLSDVPVAAAGGGSAQAAPLPGPLVLLRRALGRLPGPGTGAGPVTAPLSRDWHACVGGGGYYWEADQAFPGEVNAGDRYVLEFGGCREDGGVLDGMVILDIDYADGLLGSDDYRIEGRADFVALRFTDSPSGISSLMDGVLTFSEQAVGGDWRSRLSGERLLLRIGAEQYRYSDFVFLAAEDPLGWTRAADFVLDATDLGGRIRVTTLDPFLFDPLDAGRPWRGALEVTGAGGAWLQLVAESDARHISLWWDLPPMDGIADGTATLNWQDLPAWHPF